ncbi:MAG: hypothetical protein D8M59_06770 [Planctomycetes bacterium]|nr:hypothetical protein [Planctomycetota bacterium]
MPGTRCLDDALHASASSLVQSAVTIGQSIAPNTGLGRCRVITVLPVSVYVCVSCVVSFLFRDQKPGELT